MQSIVWSTSAELITSGLLIKKEADQNAYFRGLKWLSLNVSHSFP